MHQGENTTLDFKTESDFSTARQQKDIGYLQGAGLPVVLSLAARGVAEPPLLQLAVQRAQRLGPLLRLGQRLSRP